MNIPSRLPVLAFVIRSLATLIAPVCLLASCASHREISQDMEVSTGQHEAGSALDSDYLVRRGATLHAEFASGSRFYVEKGGRLMGLGQGVRQCTVYAESGALIERHPGLKLTPVSDARQAYADRDNPVFIKKGPGGVLPSSFTKRSSHHHHDDDDDDDFDYHRDLPDKVSISGSSYRKKD